VVSGLPPADLTRGRELAVKHTSRKRSRRRLQDMRVPLEVPSARSASLTTQQLATLQHLWHIAGLPPVLGYGTAVLALSVASDRTLGDVLSSVDFDNAGSVADGVEAVLQWRQRTIR
jgi:hypothetical protein